MKYKEIRFLKILYGVVAVSTVTGMTGGLIGIWFSYGLGDKILASAGVVGGPTLIVALFLTLAAIDDSEDCKDGGDEE